MNAPAQGQLTPCKISIDLITDILLHELRLAKAEEWRHVAVPNFRTWQSLVERVHSLLQLVWLCLVNHDFDGAWVGRRFQIAAFAFHGCFLDYLGVNGC